MSVTNSKSDEVVAELREQGLKVKIHNVSNDTWWVKGDELYTGYIATGDELLELKRANKLNLQGVKSLG